MNRLIGNLRRSRFIINYFAKDIENTSQCLFSYRYCNRSSGCNCIHSPYKTISRTHGDTSHCIISKVLRYFHNQNTAVFGVYFNCFINFRQVALRELNIQYGTDDLSDFSDCCFCHFLFFTPFLADCFRTRYNFG